MKEMNELSYKTTNTTLERSKAIRQDLNCHFSIE